MSVMSGAIPRGLVTGLLHVIRMQVCPVNDFVPEDIRTHLTDLGFLPAQCAAVGDSQSLFDAGVLDSLRLIELVARLEDRFGIRVPADDLIPDHFDSIAGMSRYVGDRLRERGS